MATTSISVDDNLSLTTAAPSSTAVLPLQITTSVTLLGTDAITSAAAPTSFTTVSLTHQSIVTEAGGVISTTTYVTTSVVTNAAQFSSLSSAASTSASSKTQPPSSNSASSTAAKGSKSPSPSSSPQSSSPQSSSPQSSSPQSSSPSLSTIIPAVVVPILFLLVALALGWFLLKRRRKSTSHAGYTQDRYDKPELDTTELPRTHGRAELDGGGDAEMLSSGASEEKYPVGTVHELPDSVHRMAELEGDTARWHEGG